MQPKIKLFGYFALVSVTLGGFLYARIQPAPDEPASGEAIRGETWLAQSALPSSHLAATDIVGQDKPFPDSGDSAAEEQPATTAEFNDTTGVDQASRFEHPMTYQNTFTEEEGTPSQGSAYAETADPRSYGGAPRYTTYTGIPGNSSGDNISVTYTDDHINIEISGAAVDNGSNADDIDAGESVGTGTGSLPLTADPHTPENADFQTADPDTRHECPEWVYKRADMYEKYGDLNDWYFLSGLGCDATAIIGRQPLD